MSNRSGNGSKHPKKKSPRRKLKKSKNQNSSKLVKVSSFKSIKGISSISKKYLLSVGIIQTAYGKLRVQFVGNPSAKELVMFIHGSGVESSSDDYADILKEIAIRKDNCLKRLYLAIDCPGYGKSSGKRQFIRTYPLSLIKEVICVLGFKKATALYGHSQGGASIFNACIEDTSICDFLIQDRPVFAKSKLHQLNKITKPVLLVYDKDDKGHPVSVGKLVAKRLPKVEFVVYSQKKQPYFWSDNFLPMMMKFIENGKSKK